MSDLLAVFIGVAYSCNPARRNSVKWGKNLQAPDHQTRNDPSPSKASRHELRRLPIRRRNHPVPSTVAGLLPLPEILATEHRETDKALMPRTGSPPTTACPLSRDAAGRCADGRGNGRPAIPFVFVTSYSSLNVLDVSPHSAHLRYWTFPCVPWTIRCPPHDGQVNRAL